MASRKPNFFIVGAPKCGTTALYHSLLEHPEVYLPRSSDPRSYWISKEPLHFCDDLGIGDWIRIARESDYAQLFADAGTARRVGEVSALYLMSPNAPHRIREYVEEDCKILITLRPPVDWMRSWHHDCLRYAHETIADFRAALAAEPEREAGRKIAKHCGFSGCLAYRKAARFSEQVSRYYDVFGKDRVKVVLMEDLAADSPVVLAEIATFLGIAPDFPFRLERQNDSHNLSRFHHLEFRISRKLADKPALANLLEAVPHGLHEAYRKMVFRYFPPLSDKSIDPDLRSELVDEFRPEVARLGDLLDRDLSHWNR